MDVPPARAIRTPADIANLIASTRRMRGLTQVQLAHRVGVSRAWLAAVEGRKSHVDLSLILRTLAALEIRLSATTGTPQETRSTGHAVGISARDIDKIIERARKRRPR